MLLIIIAISYIDPFEILTFISIFIALIAIILCNNYFTNKYLNIQNQSDLFISKSNEKFKSDAVMIIKITGQKTQIKSNFTGGQCAVKAKILNMKNMSAKFQSESICDVEYGEIYKIVPKKLYNPSGGFLYTTSTINISESEKIADPTKYIKFINRSTNSVESKIENYSEPIRAIFRGMILGSAYWVTEDVDKKFKATGLSHLLVISGSHFAIFFMIIGVIIMRLKIPFRLKTPFGHLLLRPVLELIAVGIYVSIIHMSDSLFRSFGMCLIMLVGTLIYRNSIGINSLGFLIITLFIVKPELITSYGFGLSAGATLSILLTFKFIDEVIKDELLRVENYIIDKTYYRRFKFKKDMLSKYSAILALPISASLISTPIIIAMTGNIPVYSIIANILVSPFIVFIVVFGLLGYFLEWLIIFINFVPVNILLEFIQNISLHLSAVFSYPVYFVADLFSKIPGSVLTISDGYMGVLFYLVGLVFIGAAIIVPQLIFEKINHRNYFGPLTIRRNI
ncbi:MAG: ComEC/Rec2 family competence protein [Bifidobacteriaceae bacterium]|nr:ComEC/Rec2 family competence protein [Bifidobacteriaceae bacterium]